MGVWVVFVIDHVEPDYSRFPPGDLNLSNLDLLSYLLSLYLGLGSYLGLEKDLFLLSRDWAHC